MNEHGKPLYRKSFLLVELFFLSKNWNLQKVLMDWVNGYENLFNEKLYPILKIVSFSKTWTDWPDSIHRGPTTTSDRPNCTRCDPIGDDRTRSHWPKQPDPTGSAWPNQMRPTWPVRPDQNNLTRPSRPHQPYPTDPTRPTWTDPNWVTCPTNLVWSIRTDQRLSWLTGPDWLSPLDSICSS